MQRKENAAEGDCAAADEGDDGWALGEQAIIIMVSEPSAGVAAIYVNHFFILGARRNAGQPRGVPAVCFWWWWMEGWHGRARRSERHTLWRRIMD